MALGRVEELRAAVRDVPDFPKRGIVFKDITPVLSDPVLFRASVDLFLERCRGLKIDKIVGIDARGFLFVTAVETRAVIEEHSWKWRCHVERSENISDLSP